MAEKNVNHIRHFFKLFQRPRGRSYYLYDSHEASGGFLSLA
jgi:hypothetical protein